jgi:hypothetical protein
VTVLISSPSDSKTSQQKLPVTDLVITDLTGREVLRVPLATTMTTHTITDINVSSLPSGVYTVSVGTTNVRTLMRVAR